MAARRGARGQGERADGAFLARVRDLIDDPQPDSVRWNFTKFLVGRDGTVVKRYEPPVTTEEIRADLEQYL